MILPRGTMRGAVVLPRLAERGDRVTVASNDSHGVGDSVCSATDALIVATDRQAAVPDRSFRQLCTLIARCAPSLSASDPRMTPSGSLSRLESTSTTCSLRVNHEGRFRKRAVASPHLAFASPDQ